MDQPPINTAAATFKLGNARMCVRVKITDTGILAVGGLVTGVLLSTAVLVWSATSVPRRHPVATQLLKRH